MKRLTACCLAFVFLLGVWPSFIAYGVEPKYSPYPVKQAPVSFIEMTSADDGNVTANYSYTLSWQQPGWTAESSRDRTAIQDASDAYDWVTYAEWYDVYFRNATPGKQHSQSGFTVSQMDKVTATQNDTLLTRTFAKGLAAASFYEFRIVPTHHNNYLRYYGDATTYTASEAAPVDTGNHVKPEMRAIFMTDITVDATGEGNNLTVKWTSPLWGSTQLFDGWRISYQVRSAAGGNVGTLYDRDVSMSAITVGAGGAMQYTIVDNSLLTGQTYDVKVEPLRNGKRVRLEPGASQSEVEAQNIITLGGIRYYLAYRNPAKYEYKTKTPALIKPSLRVLPEGEDYIRFEWNSLIAMEDANGLIDHVNIVELNPNTLQPIPPPIAILSDKSAIELNYWLAEKPTARSAYRLDIYFVGNAAPQSTREVYYDPAYSDFTPYSPDVLSLTADGANKTLDLVWLAFARKPYNSDEEGKRDKQYEGNPYIDTAVTYNVYVTDSWDTLDNSIPVLSAVSARALNLQPWPPGVLSPNPSYTPISPIMQYSTYNAASGLYELKQLVDNKVYYVKIVATRDPSGQVSQPAYSSIYMPAGIIELDPNMIAAPPLRETGVTESEITVTWDSKYVEMSNISSTDTENWYAVVGIQDDGTLVGGKSALNLEKNATQTFIINQYVDKAVLNGLSMNDPDKVTDFLEKSAKPAVRSALTNTSLDPPASLAGDFDLRMIDLSGALYEVHTVEYTHMMDKGGYEAYYNNVLKGDVNAALWSPATGIKPGDDPGSYNYTVSSVNAPAAGPLKSNTAYVIYLRPYVMVTTAEGVKKRVAYYPNYVMATTGDTKPPLEVDPTTPTLRGDTATDTTLTVYWLSMDETLFEYDLAYSDRLAVYPDGGTVIPWSVISQTAVTRPGTDGNSYLYFTIPDLFPDTTYYIWIRSRVGTKNSKSWSNPIEMKTLDIETPRPPQGLGLAGEIHVDDYNKQAASQYAPAEENALIIEWMRDGKDTDVPAAGGTVTGGTATALSLTDLLTMYMVRFEGLIANRDYYVRAKTVLTVTRAGNGIQKTYNYIVQMSLDRDFKDNIEYTIPTLQATDTLDPANAKRKESDWCDYIRLYTKRTTGEYDGDVNPEQYPMPEQDWEIIFDPTTGTLTHRFRSDKTDASGAKDQLADQRFISRLIAERTYVYRIDLTSYGTRTVKVRVVEMPYSIVKAFTERKITLELTAGNATVSVSPGSFDTAAARALSDIGSGTLRLTMASGTTGLPALAAGDSYVSEPQKLSAQVITPSRTMNVDSFAKPVSLKMSLGSRVVSMEQNLGMYYSNANTGGWNPQTGSKYMPATNTLNADVYRSGTYAGIAKATPAAAVSDPTRDAMVRVTAKVNITDMNQYNPGEVLNANRFNNLIAAVALNRTKTTMNTTLTAADKQALTRAKLLVSGNVTREAAINALVTLYELKTKQIIQPSYTPDNAPYADLVNATDTYRTALIKAVDVGLTDGSLRPKAQLTMGELMQMLDIVIQDS